MSCLHLDVYFPSVLNLHYGSTVAGSCCRFTPCMHSVKSSPAVDPARILLVKLATLNWKRLTGICAPCIRPSPKVSLDGLRHSMRAWVRDKLVENEEDKHTSITTHNCRTFQRSYSMNWENMQTARREDPGQNQTRVPAEQKPASGFLCFVL